LEEREIIEEQEWITAEEEDLPTKKKLIDFWQAILEHMQRKFPDHEIWLDTITKQQRWSEKHRKGKKPLRSIIRKARLEK
jgi:hypothetical protein